MTESEREEILKDIKEGYIDDWDNLTIDELFKEIEKEHKEIQQFRAIGTVEDFKALRNASELWEHNNNLAYKQGRIDAIDEFIRKIVNKLEILKTMHLDIADDNTDTLSEYDKNSHIHFAGCYSKSIKTVKQLAKEMGVSEMENTNWVACKEQLPTEYGDYVCLNKSGEVAIGFPIKKASEDGFYSERKTKDGVEGLDDVIYWQPLPSKPYEKEIDLEIEYE